MAPSRKNKANPAIPAKRGRQGDKSEKNDAPAAKKRSNDKTKAQANIRTDSVSILPSDQPRTTAFCDLEDEESLRKYTGTEKEIYLKPMVRPTGDFPRFKDGDVVIELLHKSSKHTYQLHGSILHRASPWFDKVLRLDWTGAEPDPQLVSNHPFLGALWARFELKYSPKLEIHELTRTSFTQVQEAKRFPVVKRCIPPAQVEAVHIAEFHPSPFTLTKGALNVDFEMNTAHEIDAQASGSTIETLHDQQAPALVMKPKVEQPSVFGTFNVTKDNLVIVKEEPDEDVVMVDVVETTGGFIKEQSTQNTVVIDLEQETVGSATTPVEEEHPLIEHKKLDDDLKMDDSAPIIQSAGEAVDNHLALVEQAIRSSVQREATPLNEVQLSMGVDDGQDIKVEDVIEDGDSTLQEKEGDNDEHTIKEEDLDDEIVLVNASPPEHVDAREQHTANHHTEDIDDQAQKIEGEVFDMMSISKTEHVTVKPEENPILLPETKTDTQENPAPYSQYAAKLQDFETKQESPSLPQMLDMAPLIKDEDSVGAPSRVAVEEGVRSNAEYLASSASPGLENVFDISQEPVSSLTYTPETSTEESSSDLSDCTGTKGDHKEASLPEGRCGEMASSIDNVDNPTFPSLPQWDGPSEDLTFMAETFAQTSSARGYQRASIKNVHLSSSAFVADHEPIEKRQKSVHTKSGHSLISKSVSGADDSIRESQSTEGFNIVEDNSSTTADAPVIPVAPIENLEKTPVSSTDKPSTQVLWAYNNLFRIYYSLPPIIDTENVEMAYEQSHLLIKVASLYGSIPMVRPYISSALMHFGQELYMAIMADPPRWIQLSFYLESAPIFRESMIHIVANLPNWPWASLPFDDLFSPVKELIREKMTALECSKDRVIKSLYSNKVLDVEVFSRPLVKDSFDTWFVVQYWRDWFARSLAQANKASEDGDKCTRGKVYRDLHRSGEAYLPTILVLDAVEACRAKDLSSKSKRQGIEQDLKTLKDFAQKEVQELCANYSMLSVEDAGISYLTCIKVENHEFPWLELKAKI
ncbi:hypothetical protein VTL71DRAFT_8383 [Oculimacula yallundae]|uniref:BTB domain-containing protein n=1 Tax=Oculimacula yallundae TaxID=86028 RepID=A0ABR4CXG1_9HELO